ncbi:hypothetical protein Tco_0882984, partial [Tanacetum coccineum]
MLEDFSSNGKDQATYSASAEDIAGAVLFLCHQLTRISPRHCLGLAFKPYKAYSEGRLFLDDQDQMTLLAAQHKLLLQRTIKKSVFTSSARLETTCVLRGQRNPKLPPSETLRLHCFSQKDNGSLEAESIVRAATTRVGSVFWTTPFYSGVQDKNFKGHKWTIDFICEDEDIR